MKIGNLFQRIVEVIEEEFKLQILGNFFLGYGTSRSNPGYINV